MLLIYEVIFHRTLLILKNSWTAKIYPKQNTESLLNNYYLSKTMHTELNKKIQFL